MLNPFADEVARARQAQICWSQLSIADRLRPIRSLRNLLVEQTDLILERIHADIGRPAVEVLASELLPAASALKFLEQRAERILASRRISWRLRPLWLMGCRDEIQRRAWGVVGIIGTWNYPLYLNVGPIAQALVAGNAVLWKPSENAPRTAALTHELFLKAGFPPELVQMLPATRAAGPLLTEADIDRLIFTGSESVGRKLAARLGERLIPSTLELSGCDAMFVLADANLELAAKAAWFGVALNRGQTCIAVRRIFVQRSRYLEFEENLRKLNPAVGPMELVTAAQVEHAQRLIGDAVKRGGRPINIAGESTRDLWGEKTAYSGSQPGSNESQDRSLRQEMPLTFVFDAAPDAELCREACFAPVAAVIPFETNEEAVRLAKQCSFGLGVSIFTADVANAQSLASLIPAGSVTINDLLAPTAHPATPFGGRGSSGWGVTQGAEGLLEMTVPQTITVHGGTFRPHLDEAVRPDAATRDILEGLLRMSHSRRLGERYRGLKQLFAGIRRKK
jgi:acyl-CoA reductase-like NAD-dependent aldehyde dehydrogenase